MINLSVVITKNNLNNQIYILKKYLKIIKFIELRIDTFYPNVEEINKILDKLYKFKKKIILTFRTLSEGGKIKISDDKITEYVINILTKNHKKIHFLDIELKSKIKENLVSLAKKYNKNIIFSIHLLSNNEMKNIENLKKFLPKIDKISLNDKNIIKIVLKIDNFNNYWDTLKVLNKKYYNRELSFFTIGKTSVLSRLISIILNQPITFVSLTKPVIKSQPDIKTISKNLNKLGFL